MKHPSNTLAARAASIVIGTLMLSACAGIGPTPEEQVKERAEEWLALVLKEDFSGAYEYLSPGYRSSIPSATYQRSMLSRRVQWVDGSVARSECEEDLCKVRMSVEYFAYGAVPGVSRIRNKGLANQNWIRDSGEWYLVPGD